MGSALKFYFDLMSPTARPLWILFKHAGVNCEMIPIALRKGEHFTDEYCENVNRFGKVPAIIDNGFKLSESIAIFHYLGRKEILPERWYPKNLKEITRVDEYLQWNHNNLIFGAGGLFRMQWVEPLLTGNKPSSEAIKRQEKFLKGNLDDLENLWLKDTEFLNGNQISFADLLAACLIEQVIGLKMYKLDEQTHKNVINWLDKVKTFFGPTFKEGHKFLYIYGEKYGKL